MIGESFITYLSTSSSITFNGINTVKKWYDKYVSYPNSTLSAYNYVSSAYDVIF